jgi:hypothetical protein
MRFATQDHFIGGHPPRLAGCRTPRRPEASGDFSRLEAMERPSDLSAAFVKFALRVLSSLAPAPPPLYAAACRWRRELDAPRLETSAHALAVGQPLPTLPLLLADNLAVPLELDASYEETCRILRIP